MTKSISKIVIRKEPDDYADFSTDGEYTDEKSDWAIDVEQGEYVYDLEEEGHLYCLECENLMPHSRLGERDFESCTKCGHELRADDWQTSYEPPPKSRTFRFFKPYAGGEPEGSENYRTYGLQDFKRMQEYNKGFWWYVGVVAEAQIMVKDVMQTISSNGLYGVASDSDDAYFEEIKKEELTTLRSQLLELGFSEQEVAEAIKEAVWNDM